MATLKAVRGTRDLLPPETELWNRIEATARKVFARYHFGEIRTPIFEDTGLFARSVGEETDIVSKEMYTWSDRERFDKAALRKGWQTDFRSNHPAWTRNVHLPHEASDADMVYQHPDGGFILVSFVERTSNLAWQSLKNAINEFQGRQGGDVIFGLLVYPANVGSENIPADISNDPSPRIGGYAVPGNYFASSQSLTLRPENTAGVVRAYIEHKLGESGQLQKLYYIGPQFRRERPQKGRYRQFWQIGAEVIGPPSAGSESPLRDAEVLEMLATLLDELHIEGWTLELNSVGSSADRARYNEVLRATLAEVAPKMCADCQRRAVTNPLRVLDCKVPEDQPIIDSLPKITESLDQESKKHFAAVTAALDAAGVAYKLNPRLVRGLDYYTRTTFEFTHGGLGAQNALLGGGRYDGLSEAIGGPKAPGIGFAMGLDRLVLTLQSTELDQKAAAPQVHAYIAPLDENLNAAALVLARELRRAGLSVELGDGSFRLKKSFETADKVARRIVILGEDELQSGILTVKDFATGTQSKVPRAELVNFLNQ
jgi:histidyl-tRNA synthetase